MKFFIKRVLLTIMGQKERAVQYQVIGVLMPDNPKSLKPGKEKVYFSSCYQNDAVKAIKKLLASKKPKPLNFQFDEINSDDPVTHHRHD